MDTSQEKTTISSTQVLDVKGFVCPLPVLKARKVMKSLEKGDVLEVLTTDSNAPKDFEQFCQETSYILLKTTELPEGYAIFLRKN